MSADDFAELVRRCREAQSDYFRSARDAQAMRKSKHLEALVDQAIKAHRRREDVIQGELWSRADAGAEATRVTRKGAGA